MHDVTDEAASLRAAGGHVRNGTGPDHVHVFAGGLPPTVQTLLTLQRTAGNAGVASALAADEERSPVLDIVGKGGGRPLDPAVRSDMEGYFGADFSDVRVHTDSTAAASATAVQAQAYTVGNDIVFGAGSTGSSAPESDQGQRTLAHELTHVVQQRAGAVDGTPAGGGISISDPSDRFERQAEATADAVLGARPVSAEPASGTTGAAVQREELPEEEDEEPVQTLALQRQAASEDEDEQQEYTA